MGGSPINAMGDQQAVRRGQPPPFFLNSPWFTAVALGRFINREHWSLGAVDGNLVALTSVIGSGPLIIPLL